LKNLNPPQLDATLIYNDIKEKSKNTENLDKQDRLINLETYVLARYVVYENFKNNLEMIENSLITDELDKKSLISCYNRNKDGYLEGEVVAKILEIQSVQHKNTCPYCGIDRPKTIDHYLPKSDFPEFAIYPPNLIPCCGRCNTKKNDRWINNGRRLFFHYYFDIAPRHKFLYASLKFNSKMNDQIPIVEFRIHNDGNIDPKIFSLIQAHYQELNLLEEYSEYVIRDLSSVHDNVSHNTHRPISEHIQTLKESMESDVRLFGINFWRTSMYQAIIDSNEFFNRIYKIDS
jgi:hypothetical protein